MLLGSVLLKLSSGVWGFGGVWGLCAYGFGFGVELSDFGVPDQGFTVKPQGSMCPNSIYVGLKVVPIWVLWGQCIYYMSTWTLRERFSDGI